MGNIQKNIGQVDGIRIYVLMDDQADTQLPFLAQHGLSLLLEIQSQAGAKNILLDTGQSAEPILYNMEKLGIDPNIIDAIFLSHCHDDHTKGLVGILKKIDKQLPVIGHPDIFRQHYNFKKFIRNKGITEENSRENIILNGGQVALIKEPFQIMEGVFSTGEVERTVDFEEENIGAFTILDGNLIDDRMMDDMSLIVNIRGEGLLIITGCSHAGIINIIKHSMRITGVDKIYGVIGGLHLINSNDFRIKATIEELARYKMQKAIVGHCTGLRALALLAENYGERFQQLRVGKIIDI